MEFVTKNVWAILTTVISVCALVLTLYQIRAIKIHNMNSVKPLIMITYPTSSRPEADGVRSISVVVENCGRHCSY